MPSRARYWSLSRAAKVRSPGPRLGSSAIAVMLLAMIATGCGPERSTASVRVVSAPRYLYVENFSGGSITVIPWPQGVPVSVSCGESLRFRASQHAVPWLVMLKTAAGAVRRVSWRGSATDEVLVYSGSVYLVPLSPGPPAASCPQPPT